MDVSPRTRPRDKNRFYLKSNIAPSSGNQFSFECSQWRHGIEPEIIEGQIKLGESEIVEMAGTIGCTIQAENLTDSVNRLVPVRIRFLPTSAFPIAVEIVDRMDWVLG